jgi:hypothetical protein
MASAFVHMAADGCLTRAMRLLPTSAAPQITIPDEPLSGSKGWRFSGTSARAVRIGRKSNCRDPWNSGSDRIKGALSLGNWGPNRP